ncbi:type III secretion system needle filament subunit SctF [Pantoea sp. PNT02]|uniref:type III secretion system needle filament subunit SctF n=1 Tax=Pantoea sp. PNT02 TaxID=2769261 RepID=UPI00178627A0|nr:type III secretion system needle filament subunit SctF [Pantoea sp. PNT02]MBD9646327.1 type III secretion system needle filament subunit SctF [Pantoea sp. PNT02]
MDLGSVLNQLTQNSESAVSQIQHGVSEADINDPQAMLKMQFALQQYSSYVNYQSSLIKTVRDMVTGVISKI